MNISKVSMNCNKGRVNFGEKWADGEFHYNPKMYEIENGKEKISNALCYLDIVNRLLVDINDSMEEINH